MSMEKKAIGFGCTYERILKEEDLQIELVEIARNKFEDAQLVYSKELKKLEILKEARFLIERGGG